MVISFGPNFTPMCFTIGRNGLLAINGSSSSELTIHLTGQLAFTLGVLQLSWTFLWVMMMYAGWTLEIYLSSTWGIFLHWGRLLYAGWTLEIRYLLPEKFSCVEGNSSLSYGQGWPFHKYTTFLFRTFLMSINRNLPLREMHHIRKLHAFSPTICSRKNSEEEKDVDEQSNKDDDQDEKVVFIVQHTFLGHK